MRVFASSPTSHSDYCHFLNQPIAKTSVSLLSLCYGSYLKGITHCVFSWPFSSLSLTPPMCSQFWGPRKKSVSMIKYGFSSPFDMFVEKKNQDKQNKNPTGQHLHFFFFILQLLTESKASTKTLNHMEIPPLHLQCPSGLLPQFQQIPYYPSQ